MGQTSTADVLWEIAGIKPQIKGLLLDGLGQIMGHFAGTFDFCLMGVDLFFHKAADGGDDHFLFVREAKVHVRALSLARRKFVAGVAEKVAPGK